MDQPKDEKPEPPQHGRTADANVPASPESSGKPGPIGSLDGDETTIHETPGDAPEMTCSLAGEETDRRPGQGQPAQADAEIGSRVKPPLGDWGHLELIDKVGEGGFGETFRARDPNLDREVALKILKLQGGQGDVLAGRVVREGALLARVRHPNVVIVHGAQRHGDSVGLWMEFIHGRTLESVLAEQGTLGEREAALIGVDLCRALAAVHGAGIVHRDIKTANLMRERGGRIVLMDFGLGLDLTTGSAADPGSLAGTPYYMAPEILRGEPATVRSDLYSAGVLLFRLVSGRYPLTGATLRELSEGHAEDRAVRLRDVRPDLSADFVRAVERCLEKDPAKRWATPGALESALMDSVGATGSMRPDPPTAQPEPPDAARQRSLPQIVEGLRSAEFTEYRRGRVAEWSQARYSLDREFVALSLLIDQGEESTTGRWDARPGSYRDLRELLAAIEDPAVVVLGPPGSGKSTLLRRFELDISTEALASERTPAHGAHQPDGASTESSRRATSPRPITFFLPLNYYRAAGAGAPPPEPSAWLAERWAARFPDLPPLPSLIEARRMVLLLDGLNEMGGTDVASSRQAVVRWKEFLDRFATEHPGNRVVFSCRTLDYSAPLSSASLRVPQIVIEPMTDEQVEQYLLKSEPRRGAEIWSHLRGTPQLEAMRSPYFLGLLLEQADLAGEIPRGRAGLFTGFVRRALRREVERDNPLFAPDGLLTERDVRRIASSKWGSAWALPERGPLIPKLSDLAFQMQVRGGAGGGGGSQVRIDYDEALDLIDDDRDEDIVKAGEALMVLDEDSAHGEVKFFHQLVQEYFAGRRLARTPESERVLAPWRQDEMTPPLPEVLRALPPADALPPLRTTGWEETALMAAAITDDPDGFVRALEGTNLALAGRCAGQPEVLSRLSPALVEEMRRALVERSRDRRADLRARIDAALALGLLGDPRFVSRRGPDGEYLDPPMADIPGGLYPLGEDEPFESLGDRWSDHVPRHGVMIAPFQIGRFPVTNAEWALFMRAGGYDDEQWWDTDSARSWQRGDGTAEGIRDQVRYWLERFRKDPDELERRWAVRSLSEDAYERWKERLAMTEAELDGQLRDLYPGGRLREPQFWRDGSWNNPAQPIVGICWFEARAYARWLRAQSGEAFRLPTEAEWEAAARGADGRPYSFGHVYDPLRGNTAETRIWRTTPVGVFTEGDTPEGVSDLTGNVEEWTGNLFGTGTAGEPAQFRYPYRADDGREDPAAGTDVRRVLRGGSWITARVIARAASRVDAPPGYRFNHVGLRLAATI